MADKTYDLIIVGSGMAGFLLAARIAEKGVNPRNGEPLQVALVERGPYLPEPLIRHGRNTVWTLREWEWPNIIRYPATGGPVLSFRVGRTPHKRSDRWWHLRVEAAVVKPRASQRRSGLCFWGYSSQGLYWTTYSRPRRWPMLAPPP